MIVDIEKIVIRDRIRKDFGDIQELADDIKQNGLINPPVVNKEYELLAGERRLRACKALGWKQVEIRMMDTRDAEHELNVEISENDVRKGFTKSERVDYMKRLLRIEQAKAKERQDLGKKSAEGQRAKDSTAEQFGISRDTLNKEISITENKDLLSPEDFADWDEGKLSTNKAFQKIKAELAKKEQRIAELEEAKNKPDMKDKFYTSRIKDLSDKNEDLKRKIVDLERSEYELKQQIDEMEDSQPEPEIREVEVVPDDYEESKIAAKRFKEQAKTNKAAYDELLAKYTKKCKEALELQDQVNDLQHVTQEGLEFGNLSENVFYFCTVCNNFIGNVGGLVWLIDRINDMSAKEKEMFLKASRAFRDWALVFTQRLEENEEFMHIFEGIEQK